MAIAQKNPILTIEVRYDDKKSIRNLSKTQATIESKAKVHEQKLLGLQQKTNAQSKKFQTLSNTQKIQSQQTHLTKITSLKSKAGARDLGMQRKFNTKVLTQQKVLQGKMAGVAAGMSSMFAPLLAMFAGTAIFSAIGEAGDWLDELGKSAAAYGMKLEELQSIQLAWSKANVQAKSQGMILNKIMEDRRMALDGNGAAMIRLRKAGLDPLNQSIFEMAVALQKSSEVGLAEMFKGKNLISMRKIQETAEDIIVTMEKLRGSGALIDNKDYENIARYNDEMTQLSFVLKSKIGKAMAKMTESGEDFASLLGKIVDDIDFNKLAQGLNTILWILVAIGKAGYAISGAFKFFTNPETFALVGAVTTANAAVVTFVGTLKRSMLDTQKTLIIWSGQVNKLFDVIYQKQFAGASKSAVLLKKQAFLYNFNMTTLKKMIPTMKGLTKVSRMALFISARLNMRWFATMNAVGKTWLYTKRILKPFRIISYEATKISQSLGRGLTKLAQWGKWTGRLVKTFRFMVKYSGAISAGLAAWDFHKAYSSGLNFWDSLNVTMLKFINDATFGLAGLDKTISDIEAKVKNFKRTMPKLPSVEESFFRQVTHRGKEKEEVDALWEAHKREKEIKDALINSYRDTKKAIKEEVAGIRGISKAEDMYLRVLKGLMSANKDNIELMKIFNELMDKHTKGAYTQSLKDVEFQARAAETAIKDLINAMNIKPVEKLTFNRNFVMNKAVGVDAPAGPDLRSDYDRWLDDYAEWHAEFRANIVAVMQIASELESFVSGVLDAGTAGLQNELELQQRKIELEREYWQERSNFMAESGFKNTAYYVKQKKLHEKTIKAMQAVELATQAKVWDSEKEGNLTKTIMNTAQGIMAAWAAGPIVGAIMGAIVAAAGVVQYSSISSQQNPYNVKRGMGGWIPGQGYGDNVNTSLTPGEFVVNRQSAKDNAEALEALNAGSSISGGNISNVYVTIEGNIISDDDWVEENLIPKIQVAFDKGHELTN